MTQAICKLKKNRKQQNSTVNIQITFFFKNQYITPLPLPILSSHFLIWFLSPYHYPICILIYIPSTVTWFAPPMLLVDLPSQCSLLICSCNVIGPLQSLSLCHKMIYVLLPCVLTQSALLVTQSTLPCVVTQSVSPVPWLISCVVTKYIFYCWYIPCIITQSMSPVSLTSLYLWRLYHFCPLPL